MMTLCLILSQWMQLCVNGGSCCQVLLGGRQQDSPACLYRLQLIWRGMQVTAHPPQSVCKLELAFQARAIAYAWSSKRQAISRKCSADQQHLSNGPLHRTQAMAYRHIADVSSIPVQTPIRRPMLTGLTKNISFGRSTVGIATAACVLCQHTS